MRKIGPIILIISLAVLMYSPAVLSAETDMTDLGSTLVPEVHADNTALGVGVVDSQGEFAFIASATSGKIFKFQLSNLEVIESIDMAGVSNYSTAFIDPAGTYAYFGTDTAPSKIVRLKLDDSTTTTLTLQEGNDYLRTGFIDSDGSYAYFGLGTSPGKVAKVNLTSFSLELTLNFQSTEVDIRASAYNPIHNHGYFATNTQIGTVVRVDLAGLSRLGAITFSLNAGPGYAAVFSSAGAPAAYFGTWSSPGKIIRFTASPFAEDLSGSLNLPNGEYFVGSSAVSPDGVYGYFLAGVAPDMRLVKVNLVNMERIGSLALDVTAGLNPELIMGPNGSYLYLGTANDSLHRIALTAEAAVLEIEPAPEPEPEPEPEPASPLFPTGFASGDIVKLADDGNSETYGDSTVFYLGADGNRYVFPNDKTYFTWYDDFDNVRIISSEDLASIPLRGNVTYRPGVKMIKLQTNPTVYVVGQGGELQAVPSEEVAVGLYGSTWNQQIEDINDAFWSNYTVGAPLAVASDFSPNTARDAVLTINADKGLAD